MSVRRRIGPHAKKTLAERTWHILIQRADGIVTPPWTIDLR